jgi:hypothetical protein
LTQPDQLALRLKFDANAVNKAIQQLQLPAWDKNRPDILIWVTVDNGNSATLVGLETDGLGVIMPLSHAAESRGLPVLLPLMDLQDQAAVSAVDIRDNNVSELEPASQRYQADIILTASIQQQDTAVMIDWHANSRDVSESWQTQGSLNEALQQGVGNIADKLALRYTQQLNSDLPQQRLKLSVSNVMNFADYNRLMQYLEQLDLVTDIQVANLGEQQLDLDIGFQGSETVLQRMLSVGSLMLEEDAPDSLDTRHYRLIP